MRFFRMDRNQIDGKRELFRKLSREITSESVVNAMEKVPRESFVPSDSRHMAYLDIPLSIGEGQIISQPYSRLDDPSPGTLTQ